MIFLLNSNDTSVLPEKEISIEEDLSDSNVLLNVEIKCFGMSGICSAS
jgi:hypothetical protein